MSIDWDDPTLGQPSKPQATSAWVDPLGKFYAVPDCGHSRWAEEFYGEYESSLESKGWVHISFGSIFTRRPLRQSQIDMLFDILDVYEREDYTEASNFRANVYAKVAEQEVSLND